jgi:hypothetical protein
MKSFWINFGREATRTMVEERWEEVVFFFACLLLRLALPCVFLGWLIFMFLQDLQKKEATVGAVGAWPLCTVVAEALKAPMVNKEFSPAPDIVVDKEKESTAAPQTRAEDKESVPKPTTEDAKDKAPSPSCVNAEV